MSHRDSREDRGRDYDRRDRDREYYRDHRDERRRSRDRDRDRSGRDRDRDRYSRSGGDDDYDSRRYKERRDRDKYDRRSRSRSRDRDSSRYRNSSRRDYSDDSSSHGGYDGSSKKNYSQTDRDRLTSKEATNSQTQSQQQKTETEEYLSKMSDEKLQESYDRYEADPNYDITDGLLDNIVIDKEKIQAEMQERLRQHLLAEGKVYPPPKPEPAPQTTAFANDGSFLDMFKKMQQEAQAAESSSSGTTSSSGVKRPVGPMFGKRRGGKILKTGIVEKKKPIEDLSADAAPGDAWSQYMKEVKRYKAVSCDVDNKNRPLVK